MAPSGAPALLAQLVEHFHGKEGVNGSSPLEGFFWFNHAGFRAPEWTRTARVYVFAPESGRSTGGIGCMCDALLDEGFAALCASDR